MDEQHRIFSENLQKHIEAKHISQRELAEALDVSPQLINTWVSGQAIPRMKRIQQLADYFKIPKSDLVDDKDVFSYDIETAKLAQAIHDNAELRKIVDVCLRATPTQLQQIERLASAIII